MTQQYLVGELSLLLAQIQALAADDEIAARFARLRRTAEERGPCALIGVEVCALEIADGLCWSSLQRGDMVAFDRQAAAGAQLWEFGVCAGLIPPRSWSATHTSDERRLGPNGDGNQSTATSW